MSKIVVFEADLWHSQNSKRFLGVFDNLENAITELNGLIEKDAESSEEYPDADSKNHMLEHQIQLLRSIRQTQGCPTREFVAEEVQENVLID